MPKISALPAASSVGASDLFAIVQSSTTKKATASLVLTYVQDNISISASNLTGVVALANGGTAKAITASAGAVVWCDANSFELTSVGSIGSFLMSNATSAPTWSTSLTNGQLIIGNTGSAPSFATLTGSSGITISNGPGTINISGGGGGYSWTEVTGTSQSMAVDSGYIANNVALVTLTLPSTAVVGDTVIVQGKGAGGWLIAQNSGQTIHFGSSDTTTGVGGSLASTNRYDSIELLCITANTDWAVLTGTQGNITVV